jgi:hypothetical protein
MTVPLSPSITGTVIDSPPSILRMLSALLSM